MPQSVSPSNSPKMENPTVDSSSHDQSLTFDPVKLKAKYLEEREKRLKANPYGSEQYRPIEGSLSQYLRDPWFGQDEPREPLHLRCEVLIIGGGYGGQLMAQRLLAQGIQDFRIVEKGADFGGAWYWNRYPGVQCDVESYVYMPMLDTIGYVPTEKYARGPELLQHARNLGKALGLYEKAVFKTEVLKLQWNDKKAVWSVVTDRQDDIQARFVIGVTGSLHRPKLPGFPGIDKFKGHSFHASRWDYEYTGGNSNGDLVNLAQKRVGIIGTGATAVQIVPHLGRWAKEVFVFQRTPASVDVRNNRPTDLEWAKTLKGMWQQARMDNFNTIVLGGHQEEDLVNDGWTDIVRKLYASRSRGGSEGEGETMAEKRQLLDFHKMEEIRQRVDALLEDPETAEKLKPYYNQFCKRPCFHDEYLLAFNRPNVKLVDTQGKGVERLTEKGVIANGEEFEVDCLIFATGYERATAWTHRSGMEVFGRDGRSLSEKWEDGASSLHGWTTRSFPNFFLITTVQAAPTVNFLHMTAEQATHLAYVIAECKKRHVRTVEPTQEAEDNWVQEIIDSNEGYRAFHQECTPGYYNNEGQLTLKAAKNHWHGGGALNFMHILREWREKNEFEGLEVIPFTD